MEKLGGKGMGLPFFAFISGHDELIANSIRIADGKPAGNIGHPYQPEEVDCFMTMLRKAWPRIPAADARTIEDWLRGQKQREAEALSKELLDLYNADQADRENWAKLSADEQKAVGARDETRRKRVLAMVRAGQLVAADDYYHAAMVLQHGDKPEDFLLAHELATVAAFKGQGDGKWLSAAALDRFLQNIGRPQVFGTQYSQKEGSPWTQDPYDRSLSDRVRAEFGVPSRNEQVKRLNELNARKKP